MGNTQFTHPRLTYLLVETEDETKSGSLFARLVWSLRLTHSSVCRWWNQTVLDRVPYLSLPSLTFFINLPPFIPNFSSRDHLGFILISLVRSGQVRSGQVALKISGILTRKISHPRHSGKIDEEEKEDGDGWKEEEPKDEES